jgi:acyl transferase domain-containing protein
MHLDERVAQNGLHAAIDAASAGEGERIEPIAIVGLAARLPQGADSTESLWRMIYEGRQATTKVPEDRININAFYHPNPERPDTV